MRFNEKKFFELALANKFEAADVSFSHSKSTSCSIFHREVDSLTVSDSYSLTARGIYNGKFGTVAVSKIDKDTPQFLVDSIIRSASLVETNNPSIIYKGSEKYHKKNVFNKEVISSDINEKIELLKKIEDKIRAYDKRISEVATVGYDESFDESSLSNSYGLKLKSKMASYAFYAEVAAKEGDEVKTGFKVFVSLDPKEFDMDKFAEEVAKDAINKLGGTQCKSKKYPTVLKPNCVSALLRAYLSNLDAEEVQKQSSLFIGKLHQPVASKKLTVIENNLEKNVFYSYYDDEGVAMNKKFLIKKGNLETYIYTLETAAKDGVEPTGNGVVGAKVKAGLGCIYVKPGKKSFNEMISPIKEGVYITELEGLHAGMNAKSGNFSLQAQGFMIRDGKLAEPLSLITVAGNLVEVFNSIKEIANDVSLEMSQTSSPSILIKKLAISGK
ncbi:MAG: TldD/PmbA family protein [Bacilli bacterium]|nr:TldD/PmbA family protein [Bacilli bacterium]